MNKKTLIIIIILIIAIAITVFLLWKNKDKNAENNVIQPQEETTDEQMRTALVTLYYVNKETKELTPEGRMIDVKNLLTDPYETLAKKSGVTITEKQAEELGIELSDRIGIFKMNIASAHRGKGNHKKPTQEQVQRLSELGISLEPMEKRDIIQVFIERLEMLKEQKIDVTKITQKDTIQTLAEKSGVVLTEKQAKELGIKLGYKIGKAKMHIISICRERKENKRLSKDQEQKLFLC